MKLGPQNYLSFSSWLTLWNLLCSFGYEAGREAASDGLPRSIILEMQLDEPMCTIAWEAGYDDYQAGRN